jgi:hypothetical protein
MITLKEVGTQQCRGRGMKNLKPKHALSSGPYSLAGVIWEVR